MADGDWQQEFQCVFDPRDGIVFEFALRYHRETEAYDQQVCTRRLANGIAVPETRQQYFLIQRFARQCHQRLLAECQQQVVVNAAEWQRAIFVAAEAFSREWARQQKEQSSERHIRERCKQGWTEHGTAGTTTGTAKEPGRTAECE